MYNHLYCLCLKLCLQACMLMHCRHSFRDCSVHAFGYTILHRGVGNCLLMLNPSFSQVLLEGFGGVFTTIVRLQDFNLVTGSVFQFGYPPSECFECFVFGLKSISPNLACTIIHKCDEVPCVTHINAQKGDYHTILLD